VGLHEQPTQQAKPPVLGLQFLLRPGGGRLADALNKPLVTTGKLKIIKRIAGRLTCSVYISVADWNSTVLISYNKYNHNNDRKELPFQRNRV